MVTGPRGHIRSATWTAGYPVNVLRPPVFSSLPSLERIEPATEPNTCLVTLRTDAGEERTAKFTVTDGLTEVVPEWDIFWRWPGDAESVRLVAREVIGFHRAAGGAG